MEERETIKADAHRNLVMNNAIQGGANYAGQDDSD